MNFTNIKQEINFKIVVYHVTCWLFLIAYELGSYYFATYSLPRLAVFLAYYGCNIALFYCHVELLNATLVRSRPEYLRLVTVFTLEIMFFLACKIFIDYVSTDFTRYKTSKLSVMSATGILDLLRNLYYVAFATLYWTIININNYQKKADAAEINRLKAANENADLEIRLAKAQNAYLQQQINPHLFFNALNFIHSSVYKSSPEAAENIILLSEIMRYSLEQTAGDGTVAVLDEAEQIENLIKINQSRFDYPLEISYIVKGVMPVHRMIPLVLMTLAENVFKHGNLRKHPAVISLKIDESNRLAFYTHNYKKRAVPAVRLKSIGVQNIRTRLNFTYGTSYTLSVKQTEAIYECELTIPL